VQKWIAVAQSIGISKDILMREYYLDEFMLVIDAYNEMHSIEEDKDEEVFADEFD